MTIDGLIRQCEDNVRRNWLKLIEVGRTERRMYLSKIYHEQRGRSFDIQADGAAYRITVTRIPLAEARPRKLVVPREGLAMLRVLSQDPSPN